MARDLLPLVRQALAGRYEVEREVGRGGAARVFLAHTPGGAPVALKVLHPQLAASITADRFLREIELASQLSHPRIARLLDYGEGDWLLWYVMEYVPGPSLRQHLERVRKVPVADTVRLAHDLCGALSAAHARGIIHRDVKPENIVVSPAGAVLVDFGIAKAVAAAGSDRLTRSGFAVGTSSYMSPEQITGFDGIDARSDLYSLGVILFEMLTGHVPWTGEPVIILKSHIANPIPDIPIEIAEKAGPQAIALVHRLMAKEPEQRVQTAQELLTLVEEAMRGVDRALEGSARTLLGDVAAPAVGRASLVDGAGSVRFTAPSLPGQAPATPALVAAGGAGASPLASAEDWIAKNAPPALRDKLTPRQTLYAAAGVAAFVLMIPVAVVIGVATSGGDPTPTHDEVVAMRAAGFASAEPKVTPPAPLPPPSAAVATATSTAQAAASGKASPAASGKGPRASASSTTGPKKPPQQSGGSSGPSLNVPKEVKDFFKGL